MTDPAEIQRVITDAGIEPVRSRPVNGHMMPAYSPDAVREAWRARRQKDTADAEDLI